MEFTKSYILIILYNMMNNQGKLITYFIQLEFSNMQS